MNNACFLFQKCLGNQYLNPPFIGNSTITNAEGSQNYSANAEKNSWMDLCWFTGFLVDYCLGCIGQLVAVTVLLRLKAP